MSINALIFAEVDDKVERRVIGNAVFKRIQLVAPTSIYEKL